MALAAAALLPDSFNVFRPIDIACFKRSGSIGADGVRDEVLDELLDLFASVMIKIPEKVKVMVME